MERKHIKVLSGEDIQLLNEQILSSDEQASELAKRLLSESLLEPDRFVDSTAREWARRIVQRVNRNCRH